jgi:hypothetical protein
MQTFFVPSADVLPTGVRYYFPGAQPQVRGSFVGLDFRFFVISLLMSQPLQSPQADDSFLRMFLTTAYTEYAMTTTMIIKTMIV